MANIRTLCALVCVACAAVHCVTATTFRDGDETYKFVGRELWKLYSRGSGVLGFGTSVKHVSESLKFTSFGGADIYCESYFTSKPNVVCAGIFSTGKTTMVQDIILESEYPGANINPSPSTDLFTIIVDGGSREATAQSARIETGRSVAARKQSVLHRFAELGDGFLQTLSVVKVSHDDAPILRNLSITDTPGILSDGNDEEYDTVQAWQMLAAQADMVLVLFDLKSGDIAPQYARILKHFAAIEDKVLFLFNKADELTPHDLTLAYGGIMWRLGRVFDQPEAERMLFGSFWNKPCNEKVAGAAACQVFQRSKELLRARLSSLPLETPMLRIGQFGTFVQRLEVMLRLRMFLEDSTQNYRAWISSCTPVDEHGRSLNTEAGLKEAVNRAVAYHLWRKPVLPDIERFVKAVLRAGGVCKLEPVDRRHLRVLASVREELAKLYDTLGRAVPETWAERWGLAQPVAAGGGHAYEGMNQPTSQPTSDDTTNEAGVEL